MHEEHLTAPPHVPQRANLCRDAHASASLDERLGECWNEQCGVKESLVEEADGTLDLL